MQSKDMTFKVENANGNLRVFAAIYDPAQSQRQLLPIETEEKLFNNNK